MKIQHNWMHTQKSLETVFNKCFHHPIAWGSPEIESQCVDLDAKRQCWDQQSECPHGRGRTSVVSKTKVELMKRTILLIHAYSYLQQNVLKYAEVQQGPREDNSPVNVGFNRQEQVWTHLACYGQNCSSLQSHEPSCNYYSKHISPACHRDVFWTKKHKAYPGKASNH